MILYNNNSYVQKTDHRKQSNLRILFLTKMQPKKNITFFFCCAWRLNLEMQNHIDVFLSNETASK